MQPCTIVLADDHAMFRQGTRRIIEEVPGFLVVGEVSNGLELIRFLKTHSADLVVLDIVMPVLRGLEVIPELRRISPNIRTLVLTMHKDKAYLHQALSSGADGYLLKDDADTELITAIHRVYQGDTYISPLLSNEMADLVKSPIALMGHFLTGPLSTRERQILKLLAEGKSSPEIADLLYISTRTVQQHRQNIKRKLSITKNVDLIKYAIREGYTSSEA